MISRTISFLVEAVAMCLFMGTVAAVTVVVAAMMGPLP